MKIAVTGKGGVGKSTICGLLAWTLAGNEGKVFVIDADPDMNMATIFNIPEGSRPQPITGLKDLIAERTGVSGNAAAPIFRMNPRVDDIPENYGTETRGITLLVLGAIGKGGGGCACAENAFLKQFLSHMTLAREEVVLIDMEAGIEHLGRGTAQGVDFMLIVVEPNRTSIETAHRIRALAADLKIKSLKVIGNKVRETADRDFIDGNLASFDILGFLPFSGELQSVSRGELSLFEVTDGIRDIVREMTGKLAPRVP
jgi:CO dehydrogenase maturation factor